MGRFFSQVHFLTIATVAAAVATLNGPSNCDSSGHGSRVSHTTADYVIVGAGPAGVVLAEQLSRDGKKSVVLIEAGPDSINNAVVDTPAMYPFIIEQYWNYTAQPDDNLGGDAPNLSQGRTIGGGTGATLSGNDGLAWESILQDFLEVSHYTENPYADYNQVVNTSAYGNGPLEVSRVGTLTSFENPFFNALQAELDLDEVDLNDGTGMVLIEDCKEIVSGGAINTPKLLMLSGVGPKESLKALGIKIVADIPDVGANLRDHAFAIIELDVAPEILTLYQWFQNRLPDSTWHGINGTHYTSLPEDRPHILFEFSSLPFLTTNGSALTTWASLIQPEGSGSVSINTTDYTADRLIYTNYYGTEADKAAIIAGYKLLMKITQNEGIKNITVRQVFPATELTTDDEIWGAIQSQTYTFHHPMGTVAIGKALDKNWRLNGLRGIRVVDSSTFPLPVTCHPQSTVYALANRAAKDIMAADADLGVREPLNR
uniref:Alcohol dehydrogenase [acceptor] n=1 Tax=Talaromyces marneffei PM1 TaxID=1077442 RepID=A0A093XMV8_TALMA